MRGLTEFIMTDLISNQRLIWKTLQELYKQCKYNLEGLSLQKSDYVEESMYSLHLLWNNFKDNHELLMEAQIKEDKYFTNNIFLKGRQAYYHVKAVLREFRANAKPEGNPTSSNELVSKLSVIDELIVDQRKLFKNLKETIQSINMDEINKQSDMEEWQQKLKRIWDSIEDCHKLIKVETWPDVTYHLDYMRYKNMYETTVSLFNYKIDVLMFPGVCVIPHIGIPTWKMFDTLSEVYPFAVKCAAWRHFKSIRDLLHNNKISEGDKRKLLIRTFLSYQPLSDSNEANRGAEENENYREEKKVPKNVTPNHTLNNPGIENID